MKGHLPPSCTCQWGCCEFKWTNYSQQHYALMAQRFQNFCSLGAKLYKFSLGFGPRLIKTHADRASWGMSRGMCLQWISCFVVFSDGLHGVCHTSVTEQRIFLQDNNARLYRSPQGNFLFTSDFPSFSGHFSTIKLLQHCNCTSLQSSYIIQAFLHCLVFNENPKYVLKYITTICTIFIEL